MCFPPPSNSPFFSFLAHAIASTPRPRYRFHAVASTHSPAALLPQFHVAGRTQADLRLSTPDTVATIGATDCYKRLLLVLQAAAALATVDAGDCYKPHWWLLQVAAVLATVGIGGCYKPRQWLLQAAAALAT
jgi:hypothetical protein